MTMKTALMAFISNQSYEPHAGSDMRTQCVCPFLRSSVIVIQVVDIVTVFRRSVDAF